MKLDCDIIDACRCYALKSSSRPRKEQFCAAQRGANFISCPTACCAGGCPGQNGNKEEREPFGIVDHIDMPKTFNVINIILILLVIVSSLFMA
jgi:hypothetical protein